MRTALVIAALALAGAETGLAQDLGRGEQLFEPCRSCHSLEPGKSGMAGPDLSRLKGRIVGTAKGFDYSPPFQAARAQKLTWDEARLKAYLADPEAMFKGGWMSSQGLDDEEDRAAVAAFLFKPR
jgi:cytochrome c2